MNLTTYAADLAKPTRSGVRLLQSDTPVTEVTGPLGPVTFTRVAAADNGTLYLYSFAGKLPDGNYQVQDGTEFYSLYGDFDGDRTVGSADQAAFAAAFGSRRGDAAYRADADFNDDGRINSTDNNAFLGNYGKTLTP